MRSLSRKLRSVAQLVAAIAASVPPGVAAAGGIPEPGLVMYGAVTNTGAQGAAANLAVAWTVESSTNVFTNNATILNVNDQSFYVLRIPFETTSIAGAPGFPPTPNMLELAAGGSTYTRSAAVNGASAMLLGPTNFIFGAADRGRLENLDLLVKLPPETFAQWLAQYGLAGSDPNSDPTHKGMTLMQQYIAGLNPNDPNSLFNFVGIQPVAQGVQVLWSSEPGKLYTLQQAASVNGPFSNLQPNIAATPGTNAFLVPMPTNSTTLFLRLFVQPTN